MKLVIVVFTLGIGGSLRFAGITAVILAMPEVVYVAYTPSSLFGTPRCLVRKSGVCIEPANM